MVVAKAGAVRSTLPAAVLVEVEHPDRVAAHDLFDDVSRELPHVLFGERPGVGPGRVGVRGVALVGHVVDTDLLERAQPGCGAEEAPTDEPAELLARWV